jgi:hypothetical protein
MTVDIRASVYCNLGKVISGSFSDDYLQGSGIIKTSGSVILDGIYAPAIGQKVEFAYYKNGILSRLPRSLRVLSFFADPFRRVTTVEIGCAFTYYSNRKPPATNPKSSEENPELSCSVFNEIIVPISANYVFSRCLSALGLSATSNPLTNKFNVEEFDIGSGYVQVIGDLLVSEGYFCYLNEQETVVVVNLNTGSNSLGPLISGDEIIEFGPIGTGGIPGDGAIVRYNSLRLKSPPPPEDRDEEELADEIAIRDWELDTSSETGRKTYITAYEIIGGGEVLGYNGAYWIEGWRLRDYEFPDFTTSETRTTYDKWNRVVNRRTVTRRPLASVNPSYVQALINNSVFNIRITAFGVRSLALPFSGVEECQEIQEELYYYSSNPVESGDPPGEGDCSEETPPAAEEGFDSLIQKETIKYESLIKVIGSVWQGNYYEPVAVTTVYYDYTDWQPITFDPVDYTATIITEKTIEIYDKQDTSIFVSDNEGRLVEASDRITKQTTQRYINHVYTREGQRQIANATSVSVFAYNVRTVARLLETLLQVLSSDGIVVTQAIGRNAFIESRPSRAKRISSATQKQEKNGPETENVAEIAFIGLSSSENYVEFSIPYAPDDYIEDLGDGNYSLVKSNVGIAALNFGRIQNRLLLGNRYGISLQLSADIMPPRPFDPIYVEADGVKGQYRINGTSYTFDTTGIIASTDALFWGGLQ